LLSSLGNDHTLHLQEKSGLAMRILKDSLSLQEINTRLRGIRSAADRQREQLLDATGAINEATVDIHHYVCATTGEAQEVEEGRNKEIVNLDVCHKVRRLAIQVAEGRRLSRDLFDADDSALERVSSSGTDFEDIEAYGKPLEESYLRFDDDESVTSVKTI
jgi:pantothenate kinase